MKVAIMVLIESASKQLSNGGQFVTFDSAGENLDAAVVGRAGRKVTPFLTESIDKSSIFSLDTATNR